MTREELTLTAKHLRACDISDKSEELCLDQHANAFRVKDRSDGTPSSTRQSASEEGHMHTYAAISAEVRTGRAGVINKAHRTMNARKATSTKIRQKRNDYTYANTTVLAISMLAKSDGDPG